MAKVAKSPGRRVLSLTLSLSLKLYYQNKQTIITEHTIVISLVKGDHKIAKMLIVCGSLRTQL